MKWNKEEIALMEAFVLLTNLYIFINSKILFFDFSHVTIWTIRELLNNKMKSCLDLSVQNRFVLSLQVWAIRLIAYRLLRRVVRHPAGKFLSLGCLKSQENRSWLTMQHNIPTHSLSISNLDIWSRNYIKITEVCCKILFTDDKFYNSE